MGFLAMRPSPRICGGGIIQVLLSVGKQRLPDIHPNLAQAYNKIGLIYGKLNKSEKGLEYLLKALKIWDQPAPENLSHRAIVCGNISSTLTGLKRFNEASEYALLSASYAKKAFPESNPVGEPFPQFAQMMELMADILAQGIDPAELSLPYSPV